MLEEINHFSIVDELILALPNIDDRDSMRLLMQRYHSADVMEALRELPEVEQARLLEFMEADEQGYILDEATEEEAAEYTVGMAPEKLAEIVESMQHDDAADLLDTMSKSRAESILSLIPREEANGIRELLSYEPDTAGGIMTNEFFHALPQMTVAEVINKLKTEDREVENLDTIVVCREDMKFIGLLAVEDLLQAGNDSLVSSLMERAAVTVGTNADQEVCARYMTKYELPILPVLDPRRRIIGIITFDDILEVIDEEVSEDMYRMAGVGAERPLDENAFARAFKRLPWFIVTFCGMSLLGIVISHYQVTISKVVAVSFFIPAIMGLSGNVGIQASTITVRGLAMGDINFSDVFWLLRRELLVGVIIGVICGTALGLVSGLITSNQHSSNVTAQVKVKESGDPNDPLIEEDIVVKDYMHPPLMWDFLPRFPFTVGFAMFVGIMGAVSLGTCVPMICYRFGVDPALASGPFVTTLIDIGTQTLYLALATWLLIG